MPPCPPLAGTSLRRSNALSTATRRACIHLPGGCSHVSRPTTLSRMSSFRAVDQARHISRRICFRNLAAPAGGQNVCLRRAEQAPGTSREPAQPPDAHHVAIAAPDAKLDACIFVRALRDRIRSCEITTTVRLWQRPHVKVGGRYALPPGFHRGQELSSRSPRSARSPRSLGRRSACGAGLVALLKVVEAMDLAAPPFLYRIPLREAVEPAGTNSAMFDDARTIMMIFGSRRCDPPTHNPALTAA